MSTDIVNLPSGASPLTELETRYPPSLAIHASMVQVPVGRPNMLPTAAGASPW